MERLTKIVLALFLINALPAHSGEDVFQYSTLSALMSGKYDGEMTITELLRHGNFGLGTFNNLAGEMVVLDGKIFQVDATGRAEIAAPETQTPFAVVTEFHSRWRLILDANTNFENLSKFLDQRFKESGRIQIIRVDGSFAKIKLRTVPTQRPPYRPLAEIIPQNQFLYEHENVRGTLVGFRFPPSAIGVNVPGYHLHFLSAERKFGGHVLDFLFTEGKGTVDEARSLQIILPVLDGGHSSAAQYENQIKAVEK